MRARLLNQEAEQMARRNAPDGSDPRIESFVIAMFERGRDLYRDFPWRRTHDPYAILVSEVMLQQTQAGRVVPYYERWLELFPTLDALAAAPLEAVLRAWQGLGYNRRAVSLKRTAEVVAANASGSTPQLPRERDALLELPGIGPATAAGVRAFAWGDHDTYLETNVRAVFLHELFADCDGVTDREIMVLVAQAAEEASRQGIDARDWNYALLDYGVHLKAMLPNPSRRSAHHARQSPFEGSRRQKRAQLLRAVMDLPGGDADALGAGLGIDPGLTQELLAQLEAEGFVVRDGDGFKVAD